MSAVVLSQAAIAMDSSPYFAGDGPRRVTHAAAEKLGQRGVDDHKDEGSPSWHLLKKSGWESKNMPTDENVAILSLSRLPIRANNGVWSSARLNAAMSVLASGADPPYHL